MSTSEQDDEINYPPHVQEALDLVAAETAALEERQQAEEDQRWRLENYRATSQALSEKRGRAAAIEEKDAERRRQQIIAQQARRRFQPPQS